ncbi:MAG: hypothetical protein D6733_05450 [Methanobacteriota archaeon]|nr:MAG: hypothetical protein D6733_05450 [Euryarchaeota archaeon]
MAGLVDGVLKGVGSPQYVIVAAAVFLLAVLGFTGLSRRKGKRSRASPEREDGARSDEEKVAMAARIEELEKANSDLRERLRSLEMEYLEKQERIAREEGEVGSKARELEEGLKEVYALKEMLDEYRVMVGTLKKEKAVLEAKVAELTAIVKEGKKKLEESVAAEARRMEEEKEEIKEKAKEMVLAYKKETSARIAALEEENKALKEKLEKMREQYGAWEAIEGL